MTGKSVIEVSEAALLHNLAELRRSSAIAAATNPSILAVIKADGYGHGAALCAPILAGAAPGLAAEWLGVTDVAEGVAVRDALHRARLVHPVHILVMSGMEPCAADARAVLEHALTPVVWFQEQLDALAEAARARSRPPARVHVEVDTGMSRQGVRPEQLPTLLTHAHGRVDVDGLMTHFASAEVIGAPETECQVHGFNTALATVERAGIRLGWLHAGNSSTVDDGRLLPWLRDAASRLSARLLLRSGLALWGYTLPLEADPDPHSVGHLHVQPVARWLTRLLDTRDLPPGEPVGYNATFRSSRAMRLGLLPVGYADGLRRELSNKGSVVIHGHRCPLVGRVSMNLTTVDLSGLPHAERGDLVELLGPLWTASDAAQCAGTIPYEILCAMRGERHLVP